MKKLLPLILLAAVFTTAQAQHIEYKWRGAYIVADYTVAPIFGHSEISTVFNGPTAAIGFQFRRAVAAGLNLSLLSDGTGCFKQMPVMVEFRSHIMTSRLSPFLACAVGYTIPTGSSKKAMDYSIETGGVTCGVSGGIRFAITRKVGLNFELGYQFLSMREVNRYDPEGLLCGIEPELFHLAKISAGFNF